MRHIGRRAILRSRQFPTFAFNSSKKVLRPDIEGVGWSLRVIGYPIGIGTKLAVTPATPSGPDPQQ